MSGEERGDQAGWEWLERFRGLDLSDAEVEAAAKCLLADRKTALPMLLAQFADPREDPALLAVATVALKAWGEPYPITPLTKLLQSPDVGAEAHTRILGDVLRNQFDASTEPKELPWVVGIGGNERILHGKVAIEPVVIRTPRIDTFRAVVDQREAECPGFLGGLRIADVFETGPVELGVGHHHFLGIELEESGRDEIARLDVIGDCREGLAHPEAAWGDGVVQKRARRPTFAQRCRTGNGQQRGDEQSFAHQTTPMR
ncbi:MAG: hypothetical protein NTW68_12715 [candidate division NC10 bacterium]|nr:hypothetical protein [candidate division NC10 bacterium]